MQTEISPYDATGYRDERERLALRLPNIMHLVDLKRGVLPASHGNADRPHQSAAVDFDLSKSVPPVA